MKIQKTILLAFSINKGGELIDKKIISNSNISAETEQLILNSLPSEKWKPTNSLGRSKMTHLVLPITFYLK
jgi:uncharacterized protein YrrD